MAENNAETIMIMGGEVRSVAAALQRAAGDYRATLATLQEEFNAEMLEIGASKEPVRKAGALHDLVARFTPLKEDAHSVYLAQAHSLLEVLTSQVGMVLDDVSMWRVDVAYAADHNVAFLVPNPDHQAHMAVLDEVPTRLN